KAADFRDPFVALPAGKVPGTTPVVRSTGFLFNYDPKFDSTNAGMTVLLRRLANPHLPPNNTPPIPGTVKIPTTIPDPAHPSMTISVQVAETRIVPNPYANPTVTADYLDRVPFRDMKTTPAAGHASRGKTQPYAGRPELTAAGSAATITATSPVKDQTTA